MSEMAESTVTRVQIAIANALNSDPAYKPSGLNLDKIARAAIEAMREPTKAMVSAGCLLDEELEAAESDYAVPKIWGAMIDAALKESEPDRPG